MVQSKENKNNGDTTTVFINLIKYNSNNTSQIEQLYKAFGPINVF